MKIDILHLCEGARQAKGLTVIIDVFRAFTVAPYLYHRGAGRVIPVEKVETAFQLKEQFPDCVLVGERNEKKIPGFDFGNSPSAILSFDFTRKTVIHTTSSGTRGIMNAIHADEIITGSFVNAAAIARYIQQKKPAEVSLVCMGYACLYPVEEDLFCARYIKHLLTGEAIDDFDQMKETIRHTSGARFFRPESQEYAPAVDFDLCMQKNIFNFILKAQPFHKNAAVLEKIMI